MMLKIKKINNPHITEEIVTNQMDMRRTEYQCFKTR